MKKKKISLKQFKKLVKMYIKYFPNRKIILEPDPSELRDLEKLILEDIELSKLENLVLEHIPDPSELIDLENPIFEDNPDPS